MSVQQPTCRGVRVKSLDDARVIFHGVYLKELPMVTRRLSSEERARIRPGDVYVWEEKTQHHVEQAGLSIERWTDCFAWGPSRVRDEFLFYTQKEREYRRSNNRRNDMPPQAPGERWHKQTLSVIVKDPLDPYSFARKWHMTAYFYRDNLESVNTMLARIPTPPPGMYDKARSNRPSARTAQGHSSASPSSDDGVGPSTSSLHNVPHGIYRGPGSPIRTQHPNARHSAAPYPPSSPSSSSSSSRRLSVSSVSGASSSAIAMSSLQRRPSLPPLSSQPNLDRPRVVPTPDADLDPAASSFRLRPLIYSPAPPSTMISSPSPRASSRLPDMAYSAPSPTPSAPEAWRIGMAATRRREDDAALRMFT